MTQLNIGLFGLGTVGKALVQILNNNNNFNIQKIAIKHKQKHTKLKNIPAFTNPQKLLKDTDIQTIVELINDSQAAFDIVKNALQNHKNVVSANKKMIANHLPELIELQKQTNTSLLYEASVGGGIPIIQTLEIYFKEHPIQKIEGIINGTSNYILTQMQNHNLTYEFVLQQAQKAGFAESNPTADVSGLDSLYKLSILILHAFGIYIKPDQIFTLGIQSINKQDIAFAKKRNTEIKLIAKAYIQQQKLYAYVIPVLIEKENTFAKVSNENNIINIESEYTGNIQLSGKGAGGLPTAGAVLSDLYLHSKKQSYNYKKVTDTTSLNFSSNLSIKIYVRHSLKETLNSLKFEEIYQHKKNGNYWQTTGKIKLKDLQKVLKKLIAEKVFICELNS